MSKSNRFCFTKNNYTEFEVRLLDDDSVYSKFKYLIFGKEVGESGTPHLQGYLEFDHGTRLRVSAAVKRLEGLGLRGFHVEIAKGTAAQNITYCSKDNEFIEHGDRPKGQGKRTDLDVVCEDIAGGASIRDVINRYPSQFVKFGNGLEKIIQFHQPRRFFKTEVFWLWGPTGSGKSRWAWDQCPDAYMKCSTHKWWSGYFGHQEVIMDDYRPSREMPFDFMLLLMDRYPLSVETKGGMAEFVAKKIYVTSPFSPEEICNHLEWIGTEKREQFLRRIDHRIEFPQLATMFSPS